MSKYAINLGEECSCYFGVQVMSKVTSYMSFPPASFLHFYLAH